MPLRRLTAYLIDWCLFAAWGGFVFTAVWLTQEGKPSWPANPWLGQAFGFLLTTLPFGSYFVLTEASRGQATLGKRALSLQVVSIDGARPTHGRVLARTLGKLAPWELGHTAAHQLLAAERTNAEVSRWVMVLAIAAMLAAAGFVACLFTASGHTPYDRWSSTRVVGTHKVRA